LRAKRRYAITPSWLAATAAATITPPRTVSFRTVSLPVLGRAATVLDAAGVSVVAAGVVVFGVVVVAGVVVAVVAAVAAQLDPIATVWPFWFWAVPVTALPPLVLPVTVAPPVPAVWELLLRT
jgi:hypothetical protein